MDFNAALKEFRSSYNGPKLAFVIMGGGYSALDFRKFPGSSRYYHTAVEPYQDDLINFLNRYGSGPHIGSDEAQSFRAVNMEVTRDLLKALVAYCDDPSVKCVVVNSAITTDRWRRGSNRSFIVTSDNEEFEYNLSKIDEVTYNSLQLYNSEFIDEIRRNEDLRIGQAVLSILCDNPSMTPNYPGESLVRVSTVP
jgi:hypothetical protein